MKSSRPLLCALCCVFLWATSALAYDCEYQNNVNKKNRPTGTVVVNQFNEYCGKVTRQNGGVRVKMSGEKAEFFDNNYSYEDVLRYVCDKCGLRSTPHFSGQP